MKKTKRGNMHNFGDVILAEVLMQELLKRLQ